MQLLLLQPFLLSSSLATPPKPFVTPLLRNYCSIVTASSQKISGNMAVYFKIRMQYKRKHDGSIIETTGRDVARPFLERCLVAKKGPAPSRILKGNSCTFTSTEFPLDSNCSIRLCEATSTDSTFVRGILMVLHGNSAHLRTFNTLLAEKAYSRRRVNDVSRQLHNTTNRSGSREAIAHDRNDLWTKLESEQAGYKALEQKLRCLNIGTLGLPAVSSKSYAVPPLSAGAANSYFDDSKASSLQVDIDEDEYFALIFLSSKHAATQPRKQRSYPSAPTDRIIQLFENGHLSRHPKEDYWEDKGLTYFKKTLEYFLDRGMPIQFCLPAFPCKSTNPRKTSSAAPDGAEHEAFHNLHQFCINLQDIYPPGADLIIVSDGHVFSDCIGTNDGDVYKYTEAIKELSDKIHASLSLCHGESPITFVNLNDVFHGPNLLLDGAFEIEWSAEDINRPIETTVDLKDENCRILMLRSCGFDAGMLDKATKDDENHSLTKVYRGFSRFMKDVISARAPTVIH